jgi:outer membrane biosynthesis protein TonB
MDGTSRRRDADRIFKRTLGGSLVAWAVVSTVILIVDPPKIEAKANQEYLQRIVVHSFIAVPPPVRVAQVDAERKAPSDPAPEPKVEPKPEPKPEPVQTADATPPESQCSEPQAAASGPSDAPPPPRDVRKIGVMGARRGPGETRRGALGVSKARRLAAVRHNELISERSAPGAASTLSSAPVRRTAGASDLIAKVGSATGERTALPGLKRVEIEAGPGTIQGSGGAPAARTDGAIRQEVAKWARTFQACYERALKLDPGLRGRVWLDFTISPAGSVTRVEITSDEFDVTVGGLDRCLARWFGKMRFGTADADVSCRYPLMLMPE